MQTKTGELTIIVMFHLSYTVGANKSRQKQALHWFLEIYLGIFDRFCWNIILWSDRSGMNKLRHLDVA